MKLCYVNAAPATREGMIYIVPDFDVYDGVPDTSIEAMNQLNARSGPIWSCLEVPVNKQALMSVGPLPLLGKGILRGIKLSQMLVRCMFL